MKKHFMTGMVILGPLVLTIGIVIFLVNFLTGPFVEGFEKFLAGHQWAAHLTETVPGARQILHYLAQFLILVLLFFSVVALGFVGRWFLIRYVFQLGDLILHKIPLVNKVYKTTQDIIKTIFESKSRSFKDVVLVPFPNKGIYSLGLVSSDAPPACKVAVKRDLVSVFVPTTPNPTSGYLLMFDRADCTYLEMKVEEAVKFIISCGVIHEGTVNVAPPPPIPINEIEPETT